MEHYLNNTAIGNLELEEIRAPHLLKKRMLFQVINSAWVAVKVLALLLVFSMIVICSKRYTNNLPLPVAVKMADRITVNQELAQLTKALQYLNCPPVKVASIAEGILKGSKAIGVDSRLILALLYTESQFKLNAVSPKGYKGLMQTPTASMAYADVDILYGARILEEKMKSPQAKRNGRLDMRTALAMYKGGINPAAFKYADETLALYKKLHSI